MVYYQNKAIVGNYSIWPRLKTLIEWTQETQDTSKKMHANKVITNLLDTRPTCRFDDCSKSFFLFSPCFP